jgi:hypothetical protein
MDKDEIEDLKADIQEIESCLAQGFALEDWLSCKKATIKMFNAEN